LNSSVSDILKPSERTIAPQESNENVYPGAVPGKKPRHITDRYQIKNRDSYFLTSKIIEKFDKKVRSAAIATAHRSPRQFRFAITLDEASDALRSISSLLDYLKTVF